MKKNILKTVALTIAFCIISNTVVNAQDNTVANISNQIEARLSTASDALLSSMEEIARNESPAQKQYSKLVAGLQTSIVSMDSSKVKERSMTLNDYYGGAYLNDDKELTICVTSDKPEVIETIIETVGSTEIIIEKVNYTLDEINEIYSTFNQMLDDYKQRTDLSKIERTLVTDIVENYTDVFENKVVVGISELDDEKNNIFWSLFNSLPHDSIGLEEGYKNTVTVSIRPGGGLYKTASSSSSGALANQSVGYRGYRINSSGSKIYGFTGCGHGAMSAIYRGGEKVGTLYDKSVGGKHDIAFYDKTSNTTLSNQTSYSDDVGNATETVSLSTTAAPTSAFVLVGSTVMKVGSRSFYTQGKIKSVSAGWSTDDYSFKGSMKTTALNLGGDSGGAAFIYYDGSYRIVGTMSGSSYTGDSLTAKTFSHSYIAQYRYATNALDSTIYRY